MILVLMLLCDEMYSQVCVELARLCSIDPARAPTVNRAHRWLKPELCVVSTRADLL